VLNLKVSSQIKITSLHGVTLTLPIPPGFSPISMDLLNRKTNWSSGTLSLLLVRLLLVLGST
jgi:hypothetical protein